MLIKTTKKSAPRAPSSEGIRRASRVLGLARDKKEADMYRSLLTSEGRLANKDEIATALKGVARRKGW